MDFVEGIVETRVSADQMATLRRLFFAAHTLAIADVKGVVLILQILQLRLVSCRQQKEWQGRRAQEAKLGGLIFNPETIPSNNTVDLFVEHVRNRYSLICEGRNSVAADLKRSV